MANTISCASTSNFWARASIEGSLSPFFRHSFYVCVDFLSESFCPTRNFYCSVVAQKSLDFSAYHRHGVRRKSDAVFDVEILHGFYESHCAQLHQIVVFQPAFEAFYDGFYEGNIFFYQLFFCAVVTLLRLFQEVERGLMIQHYFSTFFIVTTVPSPFIEVTSISFIKV